MFMEGLLGTKMLLGMLASHIVLVFSMYHLNNRNPTSTSDPAFD